MIVIILYEINKSSNAFRLKKIKNLNTFVSQDFPVNFISKGTTAWFGRSGQSEPQTESIKLFFTPTSLMLAFSRLRFKLFHSEVQYFYEIDRLTWLIFLALSQTDSIITDVKIFGKTKKISQKDNCFFSRSYLGEY